MPYRFVKVTREHHLTLIAIDRADVLNALHPPAHHELAAAFDEFASDPAQWIAIITGSGTRAFCAGNDLKHRAAEGRQPLPASGFAGLTTRFDMHKPVIAAVNGLALGGGFEAALACDLIIADENAQFGLPEVKIGLAALAGGLQRLPRQIGLKSAMGLVLTGRTFDAKEARELGCINEIAPAGVAVPAARRWASEIMEAAPLAVWAAKQAMLQGLREPDVSTAMRRQEQYPAVLAMRASEDASEGVRAFTERRPPRWQGR